MLQIVAGLAVEVGQPDPCKEVLRQPNRTGNRQAPSASHAHIPILIVTEHPQPLEGTGRFLLS